MPDSKLDRSSAWALTGVIASMLLVGVVSGTFSPAQITLTITVGISCLWGLVLSGSAFRERWLAGSAAFLLTLGFQVVPCG
jgi:hypothetical protein